MPLITLLVYIVLVVGLSYLAIWILGKLAPGHPGIVDNIIWVICVLIIVLVVMQAFGIVGPRVPHVGG